MGFSFLNPFYLKRILSCMQASGGRVFVQQEQANTQLKFFHVLQFSCLMVNLHRPWYVNIYDDV